MKLSLSRCLSLPLSLLMLSVAVESYAHDTLNCQIALAKDKFQGEFTREQALAYVKILTKEMFQYYKTTGSAGVDIPIVGELIGASVDWETLKLNREKLFAKEEFRYNEQEARKIYMEVTSPIAYEHWARCIELKARSAPGFHVWKSFESEELLMVHVLYTGRPNTKLSVKGTVINGRRKDLPGGQVFAKGEEIASGETKNVAILRDGDKEITVYIDPQDIEAVTVRSDWTPVVGRAHIEISQERRIESVLGELKTVGVSEDNHEKGPVPGLPTSPDRRVRASDLTLTLRAGKGCVLRGPRLVCAGMPHAMREKIKGLPPFFHGAFESAYRNICHFAETIQPPKLTDNGKAAVVTVRTWSRPTEFHFYATQVHIRNRAAVQKLGAFELRRNRTFRVSVPRGSEQDAVLKYDMHDGSKGLLALGQPGGDERVRFLRALKTRGHAHFMYEVVGSKKEKGPPTTTPCCGNTST